MCKFRDLRAEEIDVRIAMCKENGCSLLLYKDARCDMNILDETVGPMNWQRQPEWKPLSKNGWMSQAKKKPYHKKREKKI